MNRELDHRRVAFLYTGGRRARLDSPSETPSDFFYGLIELREEGWDVDIIEDVDLATAHKTRAGRTLARGLRSPLTMNLVRVAAIGLGPTLERLNGYDVLVATNQQLGTELSLLASVGLLRARVVMIVMGLLPLEPKGAARARALRTLLRDTTVVAISRPEQESIRRRLGPSIDTRYIPFGVDARFWHPDPSAAGGYVLAVGNDQHRDFALLARVWRPEWPALRIITRLPVPPAAPNVEVVLGDYVAHVISDADMRRHVQGALFSVIPLRETWQPSGQSVALQSMACGVPLIISDTPGLWDRDVMRDGATCLLARSGSTESLTAAIERMLGSAPLRAELGAAARAAVERHFTTEHMAAELGAVLGARIDQR